MINMILNRLIALVAGEAAANSDRIKVAVVGAVTATLALVGANCPVCNSILTPQVSQWIAGTIATFTVTLILSLAHRDIAAPGQVVAGAATGTPVSSAPAVPTNLPK